MRRGRVYYAKLAGGRSMFVTPALICHFAAGLHLQIPANYFAIPGPGARHRSLGYPSRATQGIRTHQTRPDLESGVMQMLAKQILSQLSLIAIPLATSIFPDRDANGKQLRPESHKFGIRVRSEPNDHVRLTRLHELSFDLFPCAALPGIGSRRLQPSVEFSLLSIC